MITQNQRLTGIMVTVTLLLFIPFIAMFFTEEVDWNLMDFAVAGFLLFGTGFMCELVLRKVKKIRHRLAICAVILVALLLVWIELAVGIFGTRVAGS